MPFLGKDWRSSGEQWIRTEHGWERSRMLECLLDSLNVGLNNEYKKKKKSSRIEMITSTNKRLNSECDEQEVEFLEENLEKSRSSIDDQEESISIQNEDDDLRSSEDDENDDDDQLEDDNESLIARSYYGSLQKLNISGSSNNLRVKQPHIIYLEFEVKNRENKSPKASVSEVLSALDMPGAVRDIKRFNYVCRLVQLIINEKLNQLSGNAQRTLFMIVRQMVLQVIKTQENVNVMRKLLIDFKKKIQDSIYFYFYYIGSQKLGEKHLATITRWQEMLENPNNHQKKLKRLNHQQLSGHSRKSHENDFKTEETTNKENKPILDNIPFDCQLEIIRRLNSGLDLVNLSKCNKNLNDIISKELTIWKNLCQFHFQQTHINSFLKKSNSINESDSKAIAADQLHDLDWKLIYFKLKRRYGHREVYADMIHKCLHCKSLFWKEIGHPCIIAASCSEDIDILTEPITPKKLIERLLS